MTRVAQEKLIKGEAIEQKERAQETFGKTTETVEHLRCIIFLHKKASEKTSRPRDFPLVRENNIHCKNPENVPILRRMSHDIFVRNITEKRCIYAGGSLSNFR